MDDDVIPSLNWIDKCLTVCLEKNAIRSSSGRIIPYGDSLAKTQIEDLEIQLLRAKSFSQINWKVVLVAIAIGILLGKLFHIG